MSIVQIEDVKVLFDGFKALDISEFALDRNELRVVIGPNGAGKTTLCDVISGKTRVSSGHVYFNGQDVTSANETDMAALGVGRKFQTPTVFDSLTVHENMELSLPGRTGVFRSMFARISRDESERIMTILKRVRLESVRDLQAKYLSHGQRQWLEISMLLLAAPALLLVDEPAAGLTDYETALTAELLLELKGTHTILVIEHDMEFVRRLNSRVTVFNEGKVLADGTLASVQADEAVRQAYLGR
jgi:urea transport system ATP-binding protein